MVCSGLPTPRGGDFSGLDYVREIRARPQFVVGEFTIGVISGRAVLPGAVPILNADGTLKAIVGGSLYLDFFLRGARATPVASEMSCGILFM